MHQTLINNTLFRPALSRKAHFCKTTPLGYNASFGLRAKANVKGGKNNSTTAILKRCTIWENYDSKKEFI